MIRSILRYKGTMGMALKSTVPLTIDDMLVRYPEERSFETEDGFVTIEKRPFRSHKDHETGPMTGWYLRCEAHHAFDWQSMEFYDLFRGEDGLWFFDIESPGGPHYYRGDGETFPTGEAALEEISKRVRAQIAAQALGAP